MSFLAPALTSGPTSWAPVAQRKAPHLLATVLATSHGWLPCTWELAVRLRSCILSFISFSINLHNHRW